MKFATIVKCATAFCTYILVVVIVNLVTDSVFAQEPSAEPGSSRYEADDAVSNSCRFYFSLASADG